MPFVRFKNRVRIELGNSLWSAEALCTGHDGYTFDIVALSVLPIFLRTGAILSFPKATIIGFNHLHISLTVHDYKISV